MRVFVIIDSFSFGGAENLLAELARAAPAEGLDLHVASLAPRSQDRNALLPVLEEAGLSTSFLDVPRLAHASALYRIRRAIRAWDSDVVHAHLGYSAILGPVAARLAGRGSVATLHHVPEDLVLRDRVKELLSVSLAGSCGLLLFVSDAARREFARRYAERASWRTVHNGVDLRRFRPGPVEPPEAWPVPAGSPVVSIVAALRRPKGHDVAIRAWPQVLAAVPTARLLLVGDGVERSALAAMVADLDLSDHVVFAGTRHDVPAVLRASTLVALPSLTEALPTSLIEAGATGRAVVATDVGGVPEVVQGGRTGLLVQPGDVDGFAAATITLLTDTARREQMGRAARRFVEERFGVEEWAARLRALYDEVGRPRRPG